MKDGAHRSLRKPLRIAFDLRGYGTRFRGCPRTAGDRVGRAASRARMVGMSGHGFRQAAIVVASAALLRGQGVITTIAGTDWVFPGLTMPALQAPLGPLLGTALDPRGNVLLLDTQNQMLFRYTPADGILAVVAGNGLAGFSGDGGSAARASMNAPDSVAVDRAGNIYVADHVRDPESQGIRRIAPDQTITTISGLGDRTAADGQRASDVAFASITSMAVTPAGELIVTDAGLNRIFKIGVDGMITVVAGRGRCRSVGDGGPAVQADVCAPSSVVADASGNLYFIDASDRDQDAYRVRRIAPNGVVDAYAGNGEGDDRVVPGPALKSPMLPRAIAVDPRGGLVISSAVSLLDGEEITDLVRVTPAGLLEIVKAPGLSAFTINTLCVDPQGNIYAGSPLPGRVFRVTPAGAVEKVAGNERYRYAGDGGPATLALLNGPLGLALDRANNLYVADTLNGRIRKIDPSGAISTIAGNGDAQPQIPLVEPGTPATEIPLSLPVGIAIGPDGLLYFSSLAGLHRINQDGTQSEWLSPTSFPGTIAFDPAHKLHYAFSGHNVLLLLRSGEPDNLFEFDAVEAGIFFSSSSTGDGGLAKDATLAFPFGVAIDPAGNIYVSEVEGHRVRRIGADGVITTFAGNGRASRSPIPPGMRPAVSVSLTEPSGLGFDRQGNLLVLSSGHLSRVTPSGMLEVIAGIGPSRIVSGDGGLATAAAFSGSGTVVTDDEGSIYLSDFDANRVSKILAYPPAFHVSATSLRFSAASGGAPTQPQILTATSEVPGLAFNARVRAAGGDWLRLSTDSGATPRLVEVTANPAGLAPGTYTGTIDLECPLGRPTTVSVAVTFQVGVALPPNLQVDKPALTFTYPRTAARRSQSLVVTNLGSGSVAASATVPSGSFLRATPAGGAVTPASPLVLNVEADPGGRRPGTYRSSITISGGGAVREVAVTMTISDREQAILLSQAGLSFQAVAGGGVVPPQSFAVLNQGNGTMLRDGRWHGTWAPRAGQTGSVGVTVFAEDRALRLRGEREVSADLRASQDPPSLAPDGVVSTPAPLANSPVAPGALITVIGERFTANLALTAPANAALPTRLGDTEVLIGARRIPLFAASAQRIDAVVPVDLSTNTLHQVLVRRGLSYSRAVPVNVADAQPAILLNAQAGGTQAQAQVVRDGEAPFTNTTTAPARVGDRVTLFCTGLGAVTPAVEAGQVAPAGQVRTQNPVNARVGGREASVSFAGLVPGQIGRYQVTLTIPAGTAAGDRVPVELESQGQASAAATLVVR